MLPEVTVVTTEAEQVNEPIVETAAEAVSEAAVEVAQIEADRDVAIAEVHAETRQAEIEASQESSEVVAEAIAEGGEWRQNLEQRLEVQETRLGEIQSTLQSLTEAVASPQSPLPVEGESVVVTPASPEAQEPAPEPERKVKRRFRLI